MEWLAGDKLDLIKHEIETDRDKKQKTRSQCCNSTSREKTVDISNGDLWQLPMPFFHFSVKKKNANVLFLS